MFLIAVTLSNTVQNRLVATGQSYQFEMIE